MAARNHVDGRDIAKMLDDLNDYHESKVAGVHMQVLLGPSAGKYRTYRLFVNGKQVMTKNFAPGTGDRTHPFGGAGGIAEAVFRQAVQS